MAGTAGAAQEAGGGDAGIRWDVYLRRLDAAEPRLFSDAVLAAWSGRCWDPTEEDRLAASLLHTQLVSRITTRELGYSHGVESSALTSVYALFEQTRTICERYPKSLHFSDVSWHVLNAHVRPFTAKWHRRLEEGLLRSLDATDEFRSELAELQPLLRVFDRLLVDMRSEDLPGSVEVDAVREWVRGEFGGTLEFGLTRLDPSAPPEIDSAELAAIAERRRHYAVADPGGAVGMALSGGGIRSATFAIGVLAALARRNVLPKIDYLSTVSGGGYVGTFIAAFLNGGRSPADAGGEPVGLRAGELPFRDGPSKSKALDHIRQNVRFLAVSSPLERWSVGIAQLSGLLLNLLALSALVSALAILEYKLRRAAPIGEPAYLPVAALAVLGLALIVSPLLRWREKPVQESWVAAMGILAALLLASIALLDVHLWFAARFAASWTIVAWALVLPLVLLSVAVLAEKALPAVGWMARLLAQLATPAFVVAAYLSVYAAYSSFQSARIWILAGLLGIAVYLLLLVDVNFTGLHQHYRRKLAGTFLIRPGDGGRVARAGKVKLSELQGSAAAPYPLINAAVNLPKSKLAGMRGRLADFFCFTPHFCGSRTTGYHDTAGWEKANPDLDLGSAMAISGAAASPQMGLLTPRPLSFWLAILNIRLNYWIRKPERRRWRRSAWLVLLEMFGGTSERLPLLNLSDGGHIENLGIYELLRRRCRFVIAVDGEQDPRMTFHAITNLQRLAAIDLGIGIDIDLEDLRLDDQGLSRSHFRFSRIRYPGGEIGYLLYVKLSLTGNEGEFLRRYRLDEPNFPHHSTADQFFTEAQFEAYRSLGEHIGDKLFMKAVLRDAKVHDIGVNDWFARIAASFLEPLPRQDASVAEA